MSLGTPPPPSNFCCAALCCAMLVPRLSLILVAACAGTAAAAAAGNAPEAAAEGVVRLQEDTFDTTTSQGLWLLEFYAVRMHGGADLRVLNSRFDCISSALVRPLQTAGAGAARLWPRQQPLDAHRQVQPASRALAFVTLAGSQEWLTPRWRRGWPLATTFTATRR